MRPSFIHTTILHAKILWVKPPGELPVFSFGVSPLDNKILTESNPYTCRILVRKTADGQFLPIRYGKVCLDPGSFGLSRGILRLEKAMNLRLKPLALKNHTMTL